MGFRKQENPAQERLLKVIPRLNVKGDNQDGEWVLDVESNQDKLELCDERQIDRDREILKAVITIFLAAIVSLFKSEDRMTNWVVPGFYMYLF